MGNIVAYIRGISRCGRQYRTEALEPLGLKGCHGWYLREICQNPGIFQEQLTQSIQVNKSNVARQVAALEEAGFVERRACGKDKRLLQLYPTRKTLELMPQIEAILNSWEQTLLQDLSTQEQALLEQLLQRLQARAEEAAEG